MEMPSAFPSPHNADMLARSRAEKHRAEGTSSNVAPGNRSLDDRAAARSPASSQSASRPDPRPVFRETGAERRAESMRQAAKPRLPPRRAPSRADRSVARL